MEYTLCEFFNHYVFSGTSIYINVSLETSMVPIEITIHPTQEKCFLVVIVKTCIQGTFKLMVNTLRQGVLEHN